MQILLIPGFILALLAVAIFVVPAPARTLTFSPLDFRWQGAPAGCLFSTPFSATSGDFVEGHFQSLYVWNGSVIHLTNDTGHVAYAADTACVGFTGTGGPTQISSDGQYRVVLIVSWPWYVAGRPVNASVFSYGSVTVTRPGAFIIPQVVLLGGGVLLCAVAYVRNRGPKAS